MECLALDVAKEYREAMDHDPDLVNRESPVAHFLRVEDYHPLKAARRLALRWKCRKELFGEDRWLLPMKSTGAGALQPAYVDFLRTGFEVVLGPEESPDRTIYLVDRSRLPPQAETVSTIFIPQISVYLSTIHAPEIVGGFSALHVVHSGCTSNINPTDSLIEIQQQLSSFPGVIRDVTVARSYEPDREHLLDYLAYKEEWISRVTYQDVVNQIDVVSADSLKGTLEKLQEKGFHRSCLPLVLGGELVYSSHVEDWVRRRISLEDAMESAPPIRNYEIAARASGMASGGSSVDATSESGVPAPLVERLPSETHDEFVRRRSRVYARRASDKMRKTERELQRQIDQLTESNGFLREDNRRMENLLTMARQVAAVHEAASQQPSSVLQRLMLCNPVNTNLVRFWTFDYSLIVVEAHFKVSFHRWH